MRQRSSETAALAQPETEADAARDAHSAHAGLAANSAQAPGHPVTGAHEAHAVPELVQLDRDHPGFRDPVYRARRNAIARVALGYREDDEVVPDVPYAPEEHGVWRAVMAELAPMHARHACAAYRACAEEMQLSTEAIPQLSAVNAIIAPRTGFRMAPVAGLVVPQAFLGALARGVFLSTQYVRHHSRPLYTPEPDVIHEVVGHAVTLLHPTWGRLNRRFGRAIERGADVTTLARVYWYTVEFGAVREGGAVRAWGAGLLSSFGELGRFAEHAELLAFDIERMARTPYDPTDYQRQVFVAPGLDEAEATLSAWLDRF